MTHQKHYYRQQPKTAAWFRRLLSTANLAPTTDLQISMSRQYFADFKANLVDLVSSLRDLSTDWALIHQVATLDGATLIVRSDLSTLPYLIIHDTLRDQTWTYCERHHVILKGSACRFCFWDKASPVTDLPVPPLPPDPPPSKVGPLKDLFDLQPSAQTRFEQLEHDHQLECCPTETHPSRWKVSFRLAGHPKLSEWTEVTVRCDLCENEWAIQSIEDYASSAESI